MQTTRVSPRPSAPRDLVNRLGPLLSDWTGRRWTVAASFDGPGQPTLAEQDQETEARIRSESEAHPLVRAVLEAFPGARLTAVRDTTPAAGDEAEPSDSSSYPYDDEGELDL